MKKLMIFLTVLVTSLTLAGCTDDGVTVIAPTYQGITVNGSLPKDNGELLVHYKGKQGIMYVDISFTNPSNVDIKSININGYTYNSSRFLPESTASLIKLEVNVGDVLGETIYSIDRFSYVNGDSTVNVNLTLENEFKVYVFKDFPDVVRESYSTDKTTLTVNFLVTDVDDIIVPETLRADIYDGDLLVDTVYITDKTAASVVFTGLKTDKHYDVKVYGSFNRDDTNGLIEDYTFTSDTYVTNSNGIPSAVIENVIEEANKVTLDVDITDTDNVIVEGGLRVVIYQDGTLINENLIVADITGTYFEDLLNDTEYTIKVLASYDLDDGNETYTDRELSVYSFTTAPRAVPLPEIRNLSLQENDIDFNLFIDDEEGIIVIASVIANLYVGDQLIDSASIKEDHVSFQVNNLFSGEVFKLELIADYDLNDGNGLQENQVIFTDFLGTQVNVAPSVQAFSFVVRQGYVDVNVSVSDPNLTLTNALVAILYEQEEDPTGETPTDELEQIELQRISFDPETNNLVFNYPTEKGVTYYIEIYADYNLRDGNGLHHDSLLRQVSYTKEAKAPVVELSDVTFTTSKIEIAALIIDADGTILADSTFARIYDLDSASEDPIATVPFTDLDQHLEFLNLYSDHEYRVDVVTKYDLDDGTEIIQETILDSLIIHTEASFVPVIELTLEEVTTEKIVVDSIITDNSLVIDLTELEAKIYHISNLTDEILTVSLDELVENDIMFENLLSNNDYYVRIYADYDLSDGNGMLEDVLLGELRIKTVAKETPTVIFNSLSATNNTLTVNIRVDDPDLVIADNLTTVVGDKLVAVLYDSNGETPQVINLVENMDQEITFTNLLSNEEYTVHVFADYNLNDSINDLEHEELEISDKVVTDKLEEINVELVTVDSTLDTVFLEPNIIDVDSVILGDLKVTLYTLVDGVLGAEVASEDLIVGENARLTFSGLTSDTSYRLVFSATYSLMDQIGIETEKEISHYDINTKIKVAPTTDINGELVTEDEVHFNLNLDDLYDVMIDNTLYAVLSDANGVKATKQLFTDTVSFDLTGFLANQDLEIKIIGDYDLDDGTGAKFAQVFGTYTFTTVSFDAPSAVVTDVTPTQNTVDVTIQVTDNDLVITDNLKAILYDKDNNPLESIDLSIGLNNISFSRTLNSQEAYTVIVVADYNLRTGEPTITTFKMSEFVEYMDNKLAPESTITASTQTNDTITLTVDVYDAHTVIIAGTTVVDLYSNGVLIATSLPISGLATDVTFTGLVSNVEYTYEVRTDYDLDSNPVNGIKSGAVISPTIDNAVSTTAKDPVTGSITLISKTITSLFIDIDVYDTDSIIETGSMVLYVYHVNDLVNPVHTLNMVAASYDNYEISGLDSDTQYVFILQVDYDLDEEDTPVVVTDFKLKEIVERTEAREDISASIDFTNLVDTTLTVDVNITDPDGTLTGNLRVVLYDSEGPTAFVYDQVDGLTLGVNSNITFTGLLNNEPYYVYILADYDLYDSVHTYTDAELAIGERIDTDILDPINAVISDLTSDLNSVSLNVTVNNPSAISYSNLKAYLYLTSDLDNSLQEVALVTGVNAVNFAGLDIDTSYTVKIIGDYSLNSKVGMYTDVMFDSQTIDTLIKVPPTVDVNSLQITDDEVSFVVSVVDQFDVYQAGTLSAEIFVDGVSRGVKPLVTDLVTFDLSGFLANQDFEIIITGTYDLGSGAVTDEIGTVSGTTVAFSIPSSVINNVVINQNTVDLEVTVIDNDLTSSQNLIAILIDGTGNILETINLMVGDNYTAFNQTVNSQEIYTIQILTDYNLRDGEGEETGVILEEWVKFIDRDLAPESTIYDIVADKTTVTVKVDVFDTDTTITPGSTVAQLYLDGVLQQTSPALTGLNNTVTFLVLQSNSQYTVKVVTNYDDHSTIGEVFDYEMSSEDVMTLPKEEIEITTMVDTVTSNSMVFDIIILDNDSVATSINAVLYDNITEVGRVALPLETNINVTFTGLTGGTKYKLVIEYDNDLNDGNGVIPTESETNTITTDEVVEPTGNLNVVADNNSLTVDYELLNPDGIAITANLVLLLDSVVVDTVAITPGIAQHVFDNLTHNSDYQVKIVATYDLNDLNGDQTNDLVVDDTDTISLVAVTDATYNSTSRVSTTSVLVTDPDDLIQSAFVTARLVRDGKTVATYVVLQDILTSIEMFNLLNDYTYTLEIVADVDYGNGVLVAEVLYTYEVVVPELSIPTVTIHSGDTWTFTGAAGSQTLSLMIDVTADSDDVVTDASYEVDVYEDGVLKETIVLANPEGSADVVVNGADSDYDNTSHAYTVVVRADVDMNDEPGHTPVETVFASKTFIDMNE